MSTKIIFSTRWLPGLLALGLFGGCVAPVAKQNCVVIKPGYVYPYDVPYTKNGKYTAEDVVCTTPSVLPISTNPTEIDSDLPPGTGLPSGPDTPSNPGSSAPQGSRAGGGASSAYEGSGDSFQGSRAGGGNAEATEGGVTTKADADNPGHNW